MNTTVKSLNKWANAHTNYGLDTLRIAFGLFLIYKGASFITHNRAFEDLIAPVSNFMGGMLTFHYIATAHIMGGITIIFGLLTRWAILSQLPIFMGAIAINFAVAMNATNLITATAVFALAVFFLFYGSGKHSADYYFKMEQ